MKPLRVLLVDDNPAFLRAAADLLGDSDGLRVVGQADSGIEAVRMTETLSPDLVVMDLLMVGMNGLEATTLVKSCAKPPRVIVVSLHVDQEFEVAAQRAGADGFVRKQDVPARLMGAIERLFEGQGYPGGAVNAPGPSCKGAGT
jgi:DNA-binding NarL/FixJ family response regulator